MVVRPSTVRCEGLVASKLTQVRSRIRVLAVGVPGELLTGGKSFGTMTDERPEAFMHNFNMSF